MSSPQNELKLPLPITNVEELEDHYCKDPQCRYCIVQKTLHKNAIENGHPQLIRSVAGICLHSKIINKKRK